MDRIGQDIEDHLTDPGGPLDPGEPEPDDEWPDDLPYDGDNAAP